MEPLAAEQRYGQPREAPPRGKSGRNGIPASSGPRPSQPSWLLPPLSGALLIGAFPRFEQGWLAWLALLPLLWFALHSPPRRAFAGGFLFALPLHLYLNLYLVGLFHAYLRPALALVTAAALVLALCCFYALFALGVSLSRWNRPLTLAWLIPTLWLTVEYLRSLGFLGYTVGFLGYTQWRLPVLLNLAASYGYWGLPFLMVALQTLALLAWQKALRGRELGIALGLWILLAGAGLLLPELWTTAGEERPLRAALIQGNSTPEEILEDPGKEGILQRYLDLTRRAVERAPGVKLVVWPETVVDLAGGEPVHKEEMEALARELSVNFLYGARLHTGDELFNSVVFLPEGGLSLEAYHKQRLVPFVEYFPLEGPLNALVALDIHLGAYQAGKGTPVFNVAGMPLSGVVCYESYFGDHTRLFAARGARHLFVLTNDAWFGDTTALEQHAQVSALRAAEMGIGVTQVANSGLTVSYDYRGRELLRSGKRQAETFVVDLDLAGRPTPYRLYGDFFPAFWGLCLAGHLAVSAWRRCRRRLRAGA